jgi:hypothetical protein
MKGIAVVSAALIGAGAFGLRMPGTGRAEADGGSKSKDP